LSTSAIPNEIECGFAAATDHSFGDWKFDYREFHQIYPLPADGSDAGMEALPKLAAILEADIAALVTTDFHRPEDGHWLTGAGLPPPAAAPKGASQFPVAMPKNIEIRVNEPDLRTWGADIRIDDPERAVKAGSTTRRAPHAEFAVLLVTALAVAWIVGGTPSFIEKYLSVLAEQKDRASSQVPLSKSLADHPPAGREVTSATGNTGKVATSAAGVLGHRRGSAQSSAQRVKPVKASLTAQQGSAPLEPNLAALARKPESLPRPMPFPETKPATVDGWAVRDVFGATAVLEGPDGVWRAARGDTVPGVGRLESIVRWGNRWIVVTDRGLISTP
jgi:hypothetical protein